MFIYFINEVDCYNLFFKKRGKKNECAFLLIQNFVQKFMQYRQRSIFVHVVLGTFIVDNDRLSIRLFNLTFHQSILSSLTKGNDSWCFIYNLFIINSQLYNISYTQSVFLNTLKNLFNEQQSTCTGTLYVLFSCGKGQKRYDKFPKIAVTATCITKYSLISHKI